MTKQKKQNTKITGRKVIKTNQWQHLLKAQTPPFGARGTNTQQMLLKWQKPT